MMRRLMEPLDSAWDGKGILVVGDTANLLLGDFDGDVRLIWATLIGRKYLTPWGTQKQRYA